MHLRKFFYSACHSLTVVCAMAISCNLAAQEAKPVFKSPVVDINTPDLRIEISVDIAGCDSLYLVADDGGDGFSFDWCDWVNPRLVGEGIEQDLTELKWKTATSGYGVINLGRNCTGGPLKIAGQQFENGLGTHAVSVIHYELPVDHDFKKFTATAGLDNGGTDQASGHNASVQFLVFTEKPPARYFQSGNLLTADHDLENVLEQFDVHEELALDLFAAEPMLANPANMDIDHLGRVWVCEVLNYRGQARNQTPERQELGDRILILEDSDGDARADKQTVFYQGKDIDSAHGICVLGDRALVSAGSSVFWLIDEDGDSKADRKELLFTGISGAQHDHGIHAFVFGPDGKLYFNFGNHGRQIKDKSGQPIVDVAGNEVNDSRQPYQQGMVFRCNLDGSELETLAWNFRNNWEVCLDSFGNLWQSDNDDDGNRGVRINLVVPFGNYGFRDETDGSGWQAFRTGWHADIPKRHWHLNDPGVMPNLLQTGAGSPTGICVYEGDYLPKVFRNQVIHCDAGPNIVRAYPAEVSGAGFEATIVNIMDGSKHNQWFRPSDVCVAPDGSLIVADWYDPGVGGHGMGDSQRGRLFRVSMPDSVGIYKTPTFDFETIEGCIAGLKSPNQAARYLGFQGLLDKGEDAIESLYPLLQDGNPVFRARAMWVIAKLVQPPQDRQRLFDLVLNDDSEQVRAAGIRMLGQHQELERLLDQRNSLKSDMERRVMLSLLSPNSGLELTEADRLEVWLTIFKSYDGSDRWMLECLGIAGTGLWDQILQELTGESDEWLDLVSHREVVWRSRGERTAGLLAQLILLEGTSGEQCRRYFRALDFQEPQYRDPATLQIFERLGEIDEMRLVETLRRVEPAMLSDFQLTQVNGALDRIENSSDFVSLARKFEIKTRFAEMLEMALMNPADSSSVQAISYLLDQRQNWLLRDKLNKLEFEPFEAAMDIVARAGTQRAAQFLEVYSVMENNDLERRKVAVRELSRIRSGCEKLLTKASEKRIDSQLEPMVAAALHAARWPDIVDRAKELYPVTNAKDDRPLPNIQQLAKTRGNVERGKLVYSQAGTCANCHVVSGTGKQVGPDLSQIGGKLARQALFESILFPSASISHNYESWLVQTSDGRQVDGVLISESDSEIQLVDAEGNQHTIAVAEIDQKRKLKLSIMPANLHEAMTQQELVDLVEYLQTLR